MKQAATLIHARLKTPRAAAIAGSGDRPRSSTLPPECAFWQISARLLKVDPDCDLRSAATLLMSTNALAWGCGGWNRSGSASFTGRYGNTYSANYSRGGSFGGGGWNRYGSGSVTGPYGNTYSRSYSGSGYYGRGYYAGGFRGGYVSGPYGAAHVGGVYRRPYW